MEAIEIWSSFNAEIRNYVMRKVKDKNTTDDIVQDIFEKVINNIKKLEKVENIQQYLYKIARNAIADAYRSRKLVFSEEEIEISGNRSIDMEEGTDKESLNAIISRSCVKPFIDKLPEKYREAVLASDIENMSQKDLAERLDISYSGAKSRVQRGREKLKDLFQECCNFEHDKYGNLIKQNSGNCAC